MTAKKFGNYYVLRLFPGEEIKKSIRRICQAKRLTNAWFFGIGACDEVELALFDKTKRCYHTKMFKTQLELVQVTGNVSADGTVHAHGTSADEKFNTIGGHIERAVISVTGEIILIPLAGKLERVYDQRTGLNLLKLNNFEF